MIVVDSITVRDGILTAKKKGFLNLEIEDDSKIVGKTYLEVPVLLCFSTFHPCTFILKHCILVLLFSYKFRSSVTTFDKVIHTRG